MQFGGWRKINLISLCVLYEENFEVKRAAKIPHEVVLGKSVYSKHTNSWIFHIRDEVWDLPGVIDISKETKLAEAKHSGKVKVS